MKTKIIEVSNGVNYGKFMLARFDDHEWSRPSLVDEEVFGFRRSLLRRCGWDPDHLWVLDLQTGEGAFFKPGGYAPADLEKHRVWVCPMFEPFLTKIYQLDLSDINALPDYLELTPAEAPSALYGYRRPGPDE